MSKGKKPFTRILEGLRRIEQMVCKIDSLLLYSAQNSSQVRPGQKVVRVVAEATMPGWAAAADHQAIAREACHGLIDELVKIGAVGRHTALRADRCGGGGQVYVHRVFVDVVIPEEGQHGI